VADKNKKKNQVSSAVPGADPSSEAASSSLDADTNADNNVHNAADPSNATHDAPDLVFPDAPPSLDGAPPADEEEPPHSEDDSSAGPTGAAGEDNNGIEDRVGAELAAAADAGSARDVAWAGRLRRRAEHRSELFRILGNSPVAVRLRRHCKAGEDTLQRYVIERYGSNLHRLVRSKIIEKVEASAEKSEE
jgi:hypothetical protein